MNRLAALLFGGFDQGLGAHNVQIFSSFVLAGCTMYLLARYLTGSPLASAIAGFAYTLSPFHLAVAMQYDALASIQWIPLYLLALLVLLQRRGLRQAVWAGAAFALVAATSYYYAWFLGWFTLLVVAAFVAWLAVNTRRREGGIRRDHVRRVLRLGFGRAAVAVRVALALLVPLLIPSARSAADAAHRRSSIRSRRRSATPRARGCSSSPLTTTRCSATACGRGCSPTCTTRPSTSSRSTSATRCWPSSCSPSGAAGRRRPPGRLRPRLLRHGRARGRADHDGPVSSARDLVLAALAAIRVDPARPVARLADVRARAGLPLLRAGPGAHDRVRRGARCDRVRPTGAEARQLDAPALGRRRPGRRPDLARVRQRAAPNLVLRLPAGLGGGREGAAPRVDDSPVPGRLRVLSPRHVLHVLAVQAPAAHHAAGRRPAGPGARRDDRVPRRPQHGQGAARRGHRVRGRAHQPAAPDVVPVPARVAAGRAAPRRQEP